MGRYSVSGLSIFDSMLGHAVRSRSSVRPPGQADKALALYSLVPCERKLHFNRFHSDFLVFRLSQLPGGFQQPRSIRIGGVGRTARFPSSTQIE
jgi:hypothetical protein